MTVTAIKSRLAPTPSGLLHPGNGVSFLITWALIRAQKGTLLLRIDDLDKARCRDAYLEDIFRTIDWLGIDYDFGPTTVADFKQNWSQHQRIDLYTEALKALRQKEYLFACDCSRKKIRTYRDDGTYPNLCQNRQLDFAAPQVAWRLHLQASSEVNWQAWSTGKQELHTDHFNDAFVVRQKNGHPAYQLASLVDDTHFDINWIVRGQDLLTSSLAQLQLAKALDYKSFTQVIFHHHALLLDDNGEKLSKSKGAGSLQVWRLAGQAPTPLYAKAAKLLHIPSPYPKNANELLNAVSARYFNQA